MARPESNATVNAELGADLRRRAASARALAQERKRAALAGDRALVGALRTLLAGLGVGEARLMQNMVSLGDMTLRAACPAPGADPGLQLLGACPRCAELVWGPFFTTLEQLGDHLAAFTPGPEHAARCRAAGVGPASHER